MLLFSGIKHVYHFGLTLPMAMHLLIPHKGYPTKSFSAAFHIGSDLKEFFSKNQGLWSKRCQQKKRGIATAEIPKLFVCLLKVTIVVCVSKRAHILYQCLNKLVFLYVHSSELLSTSIYDLVLIYVCHFHHHHHPALTFPQI